MLKIILNPIFTLKKQSCFIQFGVNKILEENWIHSWTDKDVCKTLIADKDMFLFKHRNHR